MENSNAAVESNADLEQIVTQGIGVIAKYAFQNPYSINGPFGTMDLALTDGSSGTESASGEININTLFGLGSSTLLRFTGEAKFNGSTGYTQIDTVGEGYITVRPNPPRYIKAGISITLAPGLEKGTMSVEGFFSNFEIKATSITPTK